MQTLGSGVNSITAVASPNVLEVAAGRGIHLLLGQLRETLSGREGVGCQGKSIRLALLPNFAACAPPAEARHF